MSELTRAMEARSGPDVELFFHEAAADTLVRLVADTPDADLAALLDRDEVRHAAVGNVLGRLEEFAVPHRLEEVTGQVAFRLRLPGRVETYDLDFHEGHVSLVPEEVPDAERGGAHVVIETDALDFARLVTGGANAALLFLAARLRVYGDAMLALRVGGMFKVPGSDQVAVDPTVLDPEDVSAAITGVPDAHLREVMSGGFRDLVLSEVFRRMPDYVDAARARKHDLRLGFTITGRSDGEADRYLVVLREGVCEVVGGPEAAGAEREATIRAEGADFLKLVTGHLNPVKGVLRGRLQVRGDTATALRFSSLMEIPKPPRR